MNLEYIEIAIEDLDELVELARKSYTIVGFLGIAHSAYIIKEALEKQIPKRPKADNNGNYPEYFDEWLECPECGEAIPEYTSDNETECYCVGCGQKLDWS